MTTTVEILDHGRWLPMGEYEDDRAAKVAGLLRQEGWVTRTDGDNYARPRIGWIYDPANDVWMGQVDGIDIFLAHRTDEPPAPWRLYVMLPGAAKDPILAPSLEGCQNAAEERLNTFIVRMGVTVVDP